MESWTWYDFKNVDMALKLSGDREVLSSDMDRKDMVMMAENDWLYVEFSKWNWVSLPDDEHLAEMVAYVMETDVKTMDRNGIATISSVQEDGAIKYFMISDEGDDYCLDIAPRENVSLDDVKDIVSEIDDSICPNTDVPTLVNVIAVEKVDPEIDYLVLVNKLNALPEDWEDNLDVVFATNSFGDEIEVERTACKAYLQLREYLREHDGIEVELDSARRSVVTQQKITQVSLLAFISALMAKMSTTTKTWCNTLKSGKRYTLPWQTMALSFAILKARNTSQDMAMNHGISVMSVKMSPRRSWPRLGRICWN